MRIGSGWDIHRLTEGRELVLGGIVIPFTKGEEAHSDGDVLIHAVIDALFGALSMGDIGTHFPPGNPAYRDISSTVLLEKAVLMIHAAGFFISNIDSTIILEKPKLKIYIPEMVQKLSSILEVEPENVSVKAKTGEGLGPVGEGNAVEARAVVLLEEKDESVWV